jgi:pimeloyl-ACP methyl ester carboxylesterase
MSTFVLVHGAWHGGWCYKRTAQRLRRVGHEVYTPTLTGVGERSNLMSRAINLDTHVQDIVNVIRWEELSDVVLCGHSYGGMVISGVCERIPEKLRALVYLDAFVPENNQSVMDLVPAELAASFVDDAKNHGQGYLVSPIPAEIFRVNLHDAAWVDRMCVKHPLACLEQKISLTGMIAHVPKRLYVRGTEFKRSELERIAERLKGEAGWKVFSLPCGHDLMLDMPQETTEILIEAGT